jgi:hypothetical protein
VEAALTIAETGHLAFGTLHTNSAIQSINRIIDVFPSHAQDQVRAALSFVLEGVVTQTLLPKASGQGRVLAAEVMVPNAAIRNLIREDKLHQVYSQMQIGQSKYGMQTMNQALCDLAVRRVITPEVALGATSEVDELKTMILAAGGSLGGASWRNSNGKGRRASASGSAARWRRTAARSSRHGSAATAWPSAAWSRSRSRSTSRSARASARRTCRSSRASSRR